MNGEDQDFDWLAGVRSVTFYANCRHGRLRRLWDWIRRREHPLAHPVLHSPVYAAHRDAENQRTILDLDLDTIRMSLIDDTSKED